MNISIFLIFLVFFLFESAFGICFGCKMYDLIHKKEHARYCPGGTCEVHIKEKIQEVSWVQILIFVLSLVGIFGIFHYGLIDKNRKLKAYDYEEKVENKDCVVPEWAKKIGHGEMWKEHHGCK